MANNVVTYRHDPADSTSIANNTVRRLLEDRQGRLWIRTESTLDRLDRSNGRFAHYPITVEQMLIDTAGGILIAGPAGIHRYDALRDAFDLLVPFGARGGPPPNDPIWGFLQTRNGRFWLTTEGGWMLNSGAKGGALTLRRTPWRYTVLGHEDPRGRIWIGHQGGVGTYLPDEDRFDDLERHRRIAPDGSVIAILATSDSTVWVAGGSLSRVSITAHGVSDVRTATLPDAPLTRPVWWVLEDRRGLTWAATGRGLFFHDPWAKPIGLVRVTDGGGPGARRAAVMAIHEDPEQNLWVGRLGGGVAMIGADRPAVAPPLGGAGRCHADVWAIHGLGNRRWFGTSGGLCVWQPSTGRLDQVSLATRNNAEPIVFALAADSSGSVWAGTSDGLAMIDPATGLVRRFDRLNEDRPGVVRVEGLTVGRDGRVWVGTSRSDIYRIDPMSFEVERFITGDRPALLGSEGFWTLAETDDGRLLVGGDRGLFVLHPPTGALDWLGPAAGVAATSVSALARDADGNIWFSSDIGVTRLTPSGSGFLARTFAEGDGVQITEFNRRAFTRTSGGEFLFGGMGGVVRFRPERVLDNPVAPPLVVTTLERITATGTQPVASHGLTRLVLAGGDRGFAVEFAALAHADASQVRYRYRLSGVDEAWVEAGDDRRARYPALRPGDYTFEVRATTGDGSTEGALTLAVTVPTPWWATWWFRTGVLLIAAAALIGVVRTVSTRRLERRVRALEIERRLQGERERISRDLHDNVGGQVATLVSGIELAQLSSSAGQHDRAAEHLQSVVSDARHTLSQLRETVWSLRTEGLTIRGLADRIDEDLRARQRYRDRPVLTVTTESGAADRRLSSAQGMHLFRIAQEAVSNAIAHADASQVAIAIRCPDDGVVELTILDDGKHPASTAPASGSGLGLRGMASRAAEIHGTFSWGPGVSDGTVVVVRTPLNDKVATGD